MKKFSTVNESAISTIDSQIRKVKALKENANYINPILELCNKYFNSNTFENLNISYSIYFNNNSFELIVSFDEHNATTYPYTKKTPIDIDINNINSKVVLDFKNEAFKLNKNLNVEIDKSYIKIILSIKHIAK